jgi:hypothetical protein
MVPIVMTVIPCTKIYFFIGNFKRQSKADQKPVIEHFRNILNDDVFECLDVKFHMIINAWNNWSIKIGIYKKRDKANGENGEVTTEQRIVELPKIINMRKRADDKEEEILHVMNKAELLADLSKEIELLPKKRRNKRQEKYV